MSLVFLPAHISSLTTQRRRAFLLEHQQERNTFPYYTWSALPDSAGKDLSLWDYKGKMNKPQINISKFLEIKTIDPKILIKNGLICIKPYYLNYSFIMNFVSIALLIYVLILQNDSLINLVCYILMAIGTITMLLQLRHYNTTYIDIENKVVNIYPNLFFGLFVSHSIIKFKEINKITTVSNFNESGYWLLNRRYYITVILNKGEDIKLISSNKENIAKEISEMITSALL